MEHREQRFGRIQRHPKQLDLGSAADEPALPARRQQIAKRPARPNLGHSGRIGAEVRHC
jgi:hypothetical protein